MIDAAVKLPDKFAVLTRVPKAYVLVDSEAVERDPDFEERAV